MPDEYVDYVMCTKLYHCTPLELDVVPADAVQLHWEMYQAELENDSSNKPSGGTLG